MAEIPVSEPCPRARFCSPFGSKEQNCAEIQMFSLNEVLFVGLLCNRNLVPGRDSQMVCPLRSVTVTLSSNPEHVDITICFTCVFLFVVLFSFSD